MGYPMTYGRVVRRNHLTGGYYGVVNHAAPATDLDRATWAVAGDMRRLESDTRDPRHIDAYARISGATPDQVRALFDAFFDGWPPHPEGGWLDFGRFPAGEYGDGGNLAPDPPIARPYGDTWGRAAPDGGEG